MVKLSIGIGILLTYTLMFYIPMLVIWPYFEQKWGPFRHPILWELLVRCGVVMITLTLAEVIPHIGLFISLVGACSTSTIALVAPPLCDIALRWPCDFGKNYWRLMLDSISLLVAFFGITTGTFFSLQEIFKAFIFGT